MKRKLRGAMHSKTIWFFTITMLVSGLEMYFPRLESVIDPKYYFPAFFVIGMIGVLLRIVSNKPLEDK